MEQEADLSRACADGLTRDQQKWAPVFGAIKLAQIAYTYLRYRALLKHWRMILTANRFPLRRIMRVSGSVCVRGYRASKQGDAYGDG